ncbi:Multidrug resistance outer membrane protein MdtP precursor [compost metagenome]
MNTSSYAGSSFPFRGLLAACCAAVLLSACASYKGIETSANLNQSSDYASASSLPQQGGVWPDASWAQSIGGAPLQALVDEAIAGNPNLQVAAARVAGAQAAADAAGANARPSWSANASSTYQRYTENGIIPPPLGGEYKSDNQLTLNFSYDFDFWGKHAAQLRSALSAGKAAQAEQYNARLVLSTAVARAWVQLARQYGQLDLNQEQLKASAEIQRLTQLRFKVGLGNQSENQQSTQSLASLRAENAQLNEAIALTRNQLAALLGKGPDRGLQIERPYLPSEVAIALPDALPLGLLGRRPDIVAARWNVEAAQSDIDSAKTEFYPNVNIMAFAGFSSLGLNNLLKSSSGVVGVGPAIHLPILDSGSLRANLKGRVASYDGLVAMYNQTLTEALHDVADQVQSLRAATLQSEQQQLATRASSNSFQLAQQRERVGTTNMLPVLSAQMTLLSQRRIDLDSQARRSDLRIMLIKALGGGFDAQAQDLNQANSVKPDNSNSTPVSTSVRSAS